MLSGMGRGTMRSMVEEAGHVRCAARKFPSVSAARCHLAVPGRM
jgi:hypothetical protein